jgi:hypothetical protein
MDAMTDTGSYPGISFTPPKGAVDPNASEGEAMVKWKKVGDGYTITEFDGQPLGSGEPEGDEGGMSADQELTQMGAAGGAPQPEA